MKGKMRVSVTINGQKNVKKEIKSQFPTDLLDRMGFIEKHGALVEGIANPCWKMSLCKYFCAFRHGHGECK